MMLSTFNHSARAFTPEDDAKLRRLWDEGQTQARIAAVMGHPLGTVVSRITSLGLRNKPRLGKEAIERAKDAADLAIIDEFAAGGIRQIELARKHDVPYEYVRKLITAWQEAE